ncbi:hypothetical protein QUW58_04495 [Enterocloster aldenensis]|uniref:hypothetical protein n=1 Tax=Enterocloster aldenensis TaxID=358742 RepID=UPI0025A39AE9|nr:hypothetical protein [Enterocloster aldenensis]
MYNRLVIEGNAVYEIDDECARRRQGRKGYGGKNRGSGTSGIPSAGTDPVK